jgi:hypothetical protein
LNSEFYIDAFQGDFESGFPLWPILEPLPTLWKPKVDSPPPL